MEVKEEDQEEEVEEEEEEEEEEVEEERGEERKKIKKRSKKSEMEANTCTQRRNNTIPLMELHVTNIHPKIMISVNGGMGREWPPV